MVPRPASWSAEKTAKDLPIVAGEIARHLVGSDPFCLWLRGPLGAGKTTLTGHVLRHLGLDPTLPVTSPTYTYMNEYRIGASWYAHLDLYRGNHALSSEDLGLVDARRFRGIFVEWPEKAGADPVLRPTHVLDVSYIGGGADDLRLYELRIVESKSPGV